MLQLECFISLSDSCEQNTYSASSWSGSTRFLCWLSSRVYFGMSIRDRPVNTECLRLLITQSSHKSTSSFPLPAYMHLNESHASIITTLHTTWLLLPIGTQAVRMDENNTVSSRRILTEQSINRDILTCNSTSECENRKSFKVLL